MKSESGNYLSHARSCVSGFRTRRFAIILDMDAFEKRRKEFCLEETDPVADVCGGESSGDENLVENVILSNHDTDSEHII